MRENRNARNHAEKEGMSEVQENRRAESGHGTWNLGNLCNVFRSFQYVYNKCFIIYVLSITTRR